MQHARIFNNNRLKKERSNLNPQKANELNKKPIRENSMSSSQASLIVGSSSMRSRSSSLMSRTLNTKHSDNTLIVGRHLDKNHDFDRMSYLKDSKRNVSQNDSFDNNVFMNENPRNTSGYRDPLVPIQLTIWFHELRSSSEDFMIDLNLLPNFKIGDIIELETIDNVKVIKKRIIPNKMYFIIKEQNVLNSLTPISSQLSTPSTPNLNAVNHVATPTSQDGQVSFDTDEDDHLTPSNKALKNTVQFSLINNPLQKTLDLLPRSLVQIRKINDISTVEADTIEVSIKNINLSRDTMWIITSSLINSCVYHGKRVTFLSNRIGIIKNIYKNGKKQFSGYIGNNTKIVYRSESSRLIFLIQTSREMWHFEESGEIMFHKLVNNLFPKIFRKWREKDANHSITIVLFTSVDVTDIPWVALGHGERPNHVREYFRVVVDQVSIFHWTKIMETLRLEFANFKRDVILNKVNNENINDHRTFSVEGVSLPAVKGNILEAINIGLSLIKDRFTDTDLKHSLNHLIVITPGTGLFDVDYNLMLETSKKMSSSDCALDLICLSQPPLHIVPLFRFKDLSKNGRLTYCVPNWCDISFYKDPTINKEQWIPRCKIYELQMMGVMEKEVHGIEIERFKLFKDEKSFVDSMDNYDNDLFKETTKFTESEKNLSFSSTKSSVVNSIRSLNSVDKPFKISTPQAVHDSLLLMNRPHDLKAKTSAKFNISTTNSSALGVVTTLKPESSALSTLYQLKGTDGLPLASPSLRPSSGGNSLKSIRSNTDLRTLKSNSSVHHFQFSSPGPKIIKNEDIFKPKDPSKMSGPNSLTNRSNRERSETTIKRPNQLSTTNLEETKEEEEKQPLNYFWTEISNPSKELHLDSLNFIKLGKWNQVFPPHIKRNIVKWRSFQSPAALPVYQPNFPRMKDLETNYHTQVYTLLLNFENNLELETIDDLMREMIQLRLLLGFQICDSDIVNKLETDKNPTNPQGRLIKHFQTNFNGSKIYMMLDNEIHRIACDDSSIGVQLYKKIETESLKPVFKNQEFDFKNHQPLIRTRYADEYSKSAINFIGQAPPRYNWNQFDQLLAGYDDALPEETKSFFKMKFVIMPTDIPKNAYFITNENLTDEEIRVEGLRKLIAMIERGKYTKESEKSKGDKKKEATVPEISFYTGNLYEFLSEQAEFFDSTGNQPQNSLMITDKFNKSIKLINLAHELQSANGVKIVDRTWHFTTHENCFIGNEFVTWLIENFEDIDTRDVALKFGQSLMERGLFKHVENRHGFLDGYYFYELEQDYIDKTYRPTIEKTSWFGRKKDRDITPTSKNNSDVESFKSPVLSPQENINSGPDLRRIASIGNQLSNNSNFPTLTNSVHSSNVNGNGSETSSMADSGGSRSKIKRKFVLSRSVKYNADPLKKSYRPEIVTVHYDRVHNPEHCYHIRLQWLNTSTNFIDETISNWSRLCERHGLKFVETPWKELCTIPQYNPFHSFVDLKLALNPFQDSEFNIPKILGNNKFYYHLYLLKKYDFLLDNRSAVYFLKENIEISYSWGKPSFKYAQFIHRTGAYIIEVRDNGDFVLAPNNMHISRVNNPISNVDPELKSIYTTDSQRIMLKLRKTCNDKHMLARIFKEAKDCWRDDYLKDILPTDI